MNSFEQMPVPSSPENSETSEKKVVETLKEKGLGSVEGKEALNKWMEEEEKKVGPNPEDQINLIIRQAELLRSAGGLEEAFNALNDAYSYAEQEGNIELQEKINALMVDIENSTS